MKRFYQYKPILITCILALTVMPVVSFWWLHVNPQIDSFSFTGYIQLVIIAYIGTPVFFFGTKSHYCIYISNDTMQVRSFRKVVKSISFVNTSNISIEVKRGFKHVIFSDHINNEIISIIWDKNILVYIKENCSQQNVIYLLDKIT